MAGSKQGGLKAGISNKTRYGEDYYIKLGALGGKAGNTGGFYGDRERARLNGKLGGLKSRRGKLTHCYKGHEMTEDNITYIGTRRMRRCTICYKAYNKQVNEKRKAQ